MRESAGVQSWRPFPESALTSFSTWKHERTGSTYTVIGVSTCSTNGPREGVERVVVYFSHTYQEMRHRDVAEFLDGRFVPLKPE